jgi:CubicO group peptidase (beta-lactamase class C family)
MMLVERGQMKLDDPIRTYLPELAELKVEIRREGQAPELVAPMRQRTVHDPPRPSAAFICASPASPSAVIRAAYEQHDIEARKSPVDGRRDTEAPLGTVPLAFQPSTMVHSSIAMDVRGLLIERVAGAPRDVVMRRALLDPLGMSDTACYVPEATRACIAEARRTDPAMAEMWQSCRILENSSGRAYFEGGAGLVSAASNSLRFAQMIADGGVLDGQRDLAAPLVRVVLSSHILGMGGSTAATTGPGFELGLSVRPANAMDTTPGSPGDAKWAGAWATSLTIDPAETLVAILLEQSPSNRFRTRMIFK